MSMGGVLSILSAIVGVGLVTVLVSHTQTANIVNAFGSNFANSLKVAMGNA